MQRARGTTAERPMPRFTLADGLNPCVRRQSRIFWAIEAEIGNGLAMKSYEMKKSIKRFIKIRNSWLAGKNYRS